MKAGISTWSFPGGLAGIKDFGPVARQARAAGFDGLEVAMSAEGAVTPQTPERELAAVGKAIRSEGIDIVGVATGLHWETSLSSPDPNVRARGVEIIRREIAAAQAMGVDAILVVPGAVDVFFLPSAPVVDYHDVWSRAQESISAVAPEARAAGVRIGVENVWNRFLLSPMEMARFIDQLDSPAVGAYFDVGNVMLLGYPEQWISALGKRIVRVHVKDFRRSVGTAGGFVDLLSGEIDWPVVTAALREIGYDGWVTAEMIPPYTHYPEVLIENTARALRAILRGSA